MCAKLSFRTAAQILQESGWRGLFNGLQPSLVGTAVSQGVYFYFYSALRQLAVARHQQRTRSASVVHARETSPGHACTFSCTIAACLCAALAAYLCASQMCVLHVIPSEPACPCPARSRAACV